jgi:hypothetical protein
MAMVQAIGMVVIGTPIMSIETQDSNYVIVKENMNVTNHPYSIILK